jgi:hypothetical protein
MAITIGGMSLPGPGDVLDAIRGVTGWGVEATELLAGLPARADALLTEVEQLIGTINAVTARADRLVGRIEGVSDRAAALVAEAGSLSDSAGELLTIYKPLATEAAPLARRFVEELSEGEIIAAIRLVDQLPALAEHLETDIMPILGTLDHVGPDINELLAVVKDLRKAMDGIPGLSMLRRRGIPRPPEPPTPPART